MAIGYADQRSEKAFPITLQELKHRFQARMARRAAYNRTYQELSRMTDAELAQLRVPRSMIPTLAREAADLH